MAKPRVLILRAPGTNCDVETQFAFEQAGAIAERVHVNRLRETSSLLHDYQVLCLPGGFSYGDDVAAGRILGSQLQYELGEVMKEFKSKEKLILGICNGFQVLMKSGVLLPEDDEGPVATLGWNDSGRFLDRWVELQSSGSKCVFLRGIDRMFLPMAHAEGKFVARNNDVLGHLDANEQFALRYTKPDGSSDNPNGSMADVAGCCDTTGRVFGLMPHPERYLDPTNHPNWTRMNDLPSEGDGCALFRNAVEFFG